MNFEAKKSVSRGRDSNPRSRKTLDLQSSAIVHSATPGLINIITLLITTLLKNSITIMDRNFFTLYVIMSFMIKRFINPQSVWYFNWVDNSMD